MFCGQHSFTVHINGRFGVFIPRACTVSGCQSLDDLLWSPKYSSINRQISSVHVQKNTIARCTNCIHVMGMNLPPIWPCFVTREKTTTGMKFKVLVTTNVHKYSKSVYWSDGCEHSKRKQWHCMHEQSLRQHMHGILSGHENTMTITTWWWVCDCKNTYYSIAKSKYQVTTEHHQKLKVSFSNVLEMNRVNRLTLPTVWTIGGLVTTKSHWN